jgi:hypothetical protein
MSFNNSCYLGVLLKSANYDESALKSLFLCEIFCVCHINDSDDFCCSNGILVVRFYSCVVVISVFYNIKCKLISGRYFVLRHF